MQKLIAFWKKDLLNKLILLTGAVLVAGIFLLVYLIVTMPEKSLFMETYFPNLGSDTGLPTLAPPPVTPTSPPTPTTKPFPTLDLSTPTATQDTAAPTQSESTSAPTATPTWTATPLPTQLPALSGNPAGCIPSGPVETGRVVEVLDGNTIRVLITDKVYVVRYLGIAVQSDGNPAFPFGTAATLENGRLVFGKDIQLVRDTTDKDPSGRLLRYVKVGDVFINYEMLYRGLATAADTSPDSSCAAVLSAAEQQARSERKGQWSLAPTP